MTARAQTRELEQLKSLGAAAVITKPFDPLKLADMVRGHLRSERFATTDAGFCNVCAQMRLRSQHSARISEATQIHPQHWKAYNRAPTSLLGCRRF